MFAQRYAPGRCYEELIKMLRLSSVNMRKSAYLSVYFFLVCCSVPVKNKIANDTIVPKNHRDSTQEKSKLDSSTIIALDHAIETCGYYDAPNEEVFPAETVRFWTRRFGRDKVRELPIETIRENIESTKQVIQGLSDGKEKDNCLVKLAGSYSMLYFQLKYLKQYVDSDETKSKNRKDEISVQLAKLTKQAWDEEHNVLLSIYSNYPEYSHFDEIIYRIGYQIEMQIYEPGFEQNKKEYTFQHAKKYYEELISEYPNSTFVLNAWIMIGEYNFSVKKDFKKAARAFRFAIKKREGFEADHLLLTISMLRLAECALELRQFEELDRLLQSILNTRHSQYMMEAVCMLSLRVATRLNTNKN